MTSVIISGFFFYTREKGRGLLCWGCFQFRNRILRKFVRLFLFFFSELWSPFRLLKLFRYVYKFSSILNCFFFHPEVRDGNLSSWVDRERFPGYFLMDSFSLYQMGERGMIPR